MVELPQLQQLLLDLIAPQPVIAETAVAALEPGDWNQILAMVRQHRLGPLLYWQLTRARFNLPIPPNTLDELATVLKQSTLRALLMQRELVLIHRLLGAAGIPYMALKGAFLAFHAYPQPGLRPMMDLDILVPKDEALRAFDVLIAGGLVRPQQYPGRPEAQMRISPHLPPLYSASGLTMVELHSRLSTPEDEQDETDPSYDPAFWARAITRQVGAVALSFPAPSDQLLHLIVHAVDGHRLSNGPLILSDIAYLLRTQTIDWAAFWQAAERGGYERACWLMLRLVADAWGDQAIGWPAPVPAYAGADLAMAAAATLMLREVRAGEDARLAVVFEQQGSGGGMLYLLLKRLIPSKVQMAAIYPVQAESPRIYFYYLVRLWRLATSQRLSSYLKTRGEEPIRTARLQLGELERWLHG